PTCPARASPDPAMIVTLWLTVPTPGYGVEPDGARLITSLSPAHASAACTVPNGLDLEFAAQSEPEPDGATNHVLDAARAPWVMGDIAAKAQNAPRVAATRSARRMVKLPRTGDAIGELWIMV